MNVEQQKGNPKGRHLADMVGGIGCLLLGAVLCVTAIGCEPRSSAPTPNPNKDAAQQVSPPERTAACPDSLRPELEEQARDRLRDQPAPEELAFVACEATPERARLCYKKELGGGRGLFFLVYFERQLDDWRFSFSDAVVLPLNQDDGRATGLSDVLKTRNQSYWFPGEDFSE